MRSAKLASEVISRAEKHTVRIFSQYFKWKSEIGEIPHTHQDMLCSHPARLHSYTHNEVLLEPPEYSRCSNKRIYNLFQRNLITQFVLGQLLASPTRTSGNNVTTTTHHDALLIKGQIRRAAPRSVHPRRSRVRRPGARRRLGVRNRRVRRIQRRYA